ncbi:MAG: response regulator [Alteromonadaceae bacterium]|nr:response regulator [Alteromonadaceae bacterium]
MAQQLHTMARQVRELDLDTLVEPVSPGQGRRARPVSELERALNTMRLQLLERARALRQNAHQASIERDQALQANEAKTRFLANISHELRIPLQSVSGYGSLLADTPLDPEQREYTQTLLSAADSLAIIISDLLDISSIEAGKMELEDVPFDLRDTLNDLVHMLGGRAREKGLELDVRVDETLPWELAGDPVRIRQVLLNLLSNAIKYTDSGHVLIGVEVLSRKGGQVRLRLSVEDTGIGIAPDDIERIYQPHVQLNHRFSQPLTGAGLGLTISRQLAGLMGGTLDVESRPGQGSTFWMELSFRDAGSSSQALVRPDNRSIQGRRILVLDSYELSRKITLEVLSRHDLVIDSVGSGGETLALLEMANESGNDYHALVMDGFVADTDSERLCQQIHNDPRWATLRLMILTSNPQRGDAEHFRAAGADAFLSKTLRESWLTPMLNQMFIDADNHERRFLTRFSLQAVSDIDRRQQQITCGRMRVLLVEDNPVNQALTRRLLEKLNCEVTTANDGVQASRLWQSRPFDFILMDCVMPEMDGFEATRQLRQWEKDNGHSPVPVVALTANASEDDEEQCHAAGMDSFIAKPVKMDMLKAVLEQYRPECEPS